MFDGFTEAKVDVGDGVELRVRHGGEGAPVVLLHGHPRTQVTHLAVLDSVPIAEALDRVDAALPRRGGTGSSSRSAVHDPATVHAMLEDYRAGLGVDRAADEADLADRRPDRERASHGRGRTRRAGNPSRRLHQAVTK